MLSLYVRNQKFIASPNSHNEMQCEEPAVTEKRVRDMFNCGNINDSRSWRAFDSVALIRANRGPQVVA